MGTETFDTDELVHLALEAIERNNNKEAMALLKQAVASDPESGPAIYLLGAVHAQVGLYERAISEMSRAVELVPEMYPAHFQLGLLYLTSGKVEEAKHAWKPLEQLAPDHYYYLFKTGLEHLVNDEFETCIELLHKGIARNQDNPALNDDMAKLMYSAQQALENGEPKKGTQDSTSGRHVLLSSYQQEQSDEE